MRTKDIKYCSKCKNHYSVAYESGQPTSPTNPDITIRCPYCNSRRMMMKVDSVIVEKATQAELDALSTKDPSRDFTEKPIIK